MPTPIRRKGPLGAGMVEQVARGAVDAVGQLGGVGQGVAAGDQLEVLALELQRHGAAGQPLGLGAVGDLLGQPPDMAVEEVGVGGVLEEGGFLGDRLGALVAVHAAGVEAARQVPEPVAHAAEAGAKVGAVPAQEVGDGADACLFQRGLGRGADAPDDADGLGFRKASVSALADHREAAGLVEVGGDLGEELVVRQADGAGEAQFILHPFGQPGQQDGGGCAVQAGGAGEVEEGLVQREGFDGGGQLLHHRADGAGGFGVGGQAGFDDHRLGAELQGLEHRHGRADALDAGDVAAGRDDAAGPPPTITGWSRRAGLSRFSTLA
jgi:hypothetical protein